MKRALRWVGIGFGVLVALIVVCVGGVYAMSGRRVARTWDVQPKAVVVGGDSATIARGDHLAQTSGCTDCHGSNFAGTTFMDVAPIGRLFASNLTSGQGGVGGTFTDVDWVRAIRHGVGKDGRGLMVMPSNEFNAMSDEDLGALVAYLKTLPPVDNQAPEPNVVGPVGRALFLAGQLPLLPVELIDHTRTDFTAPPAGPTAEYGRYLANGCRGCHGEGYSGGKMAGGDPSWPVVANISPDAATGIGSWTEEDFFRALREGKKPDGSAIDEFMPWRNTMKMTDDEIRALWLYLRTVPARPAGTH